MMVQHPSHRQELLHARNVSEWLTLWQATSQNYVPIPEAATRRLLPASECFHLCIKGLELNSAGLAWLHDAAKVNHHPQGKQLRAQATLYDGHTATVFGSQCTSLPVWLPSPGAVSDSLLHLDFDVFWHSQVWDPKVSLLLQFTLASRDETGALVDEYCVAWSRLDLVQELQRKHLVEKGAHAGCFASKLYQGSSAYVMLVESAPNAMAASLPSPLVLESCRTIYTCGCSDSFDVARPYLLQDQLVTHTTYIPGIARNSISVKEAQHSPDATGKAVGKCLANAVQHPTQSVVLQGLAISIDKSIFRVLTGESTAADVQHLMDRLERTQEHVRGTTKVVSFPAADEQSPRPAPAPATASGSPEPSATDEQRSPSPRRSKVSWLRSPFVKHRRAHSEEPRQEQSVPSGDSTPLPADTGADVQEASEPAVQQNKEARARGSRTPGARFRSLSPFSGGAWLPHWRLPHLNKKGAKDAEGDTAGGPGSTAENDFSAELLQSLRKTDTTGAPVQEQRVFAKVGQKWERGVVVSVDASGDQQRVQVQVNGSVQSIDREQVVVPVQAADCSAEAASVATSAAADEWSVPELVASLKEDDKSQPLIDGQHVFASLKGKWQSGVVVMSRAVSGATCYTIMVGRDIYDLNRDELCARVASGNEPDAVSDTLPADADSAVGDDLAQSLKLDKKQRPISEKQPVFAKVDGDWQMGVVVSVRSDAQQQMVYSIHLRHGVHDFNRNEICPRVQVPKKRRTLPRWQQEILNKFQRPKSATPGDDAVAGTEAEATPAFPSAAEALQQAPRQDSVPAAVAEGTVLDFQDDGDMPHQGQSSIAHAPGSMCTFEHQAQHNARRHRHAKTDMAQTSASLKSLLFQNDCCVLDVEGEPVGESIENMQCPSTAHPDTSQHRSVNSTETHTGQFGSFGAGTSLLQQQTRGRPVTSEAEFVLCVSVHNGIHVIGREVVSTACDTRSTADSSWVTIQCTEQLALDWVPQDMCCNILVELRQLDPRQTDLHEDGGKNLAGSRRLAWTIVVPFQDISTCSATLSTAPQWVPMQTGPGMDPRGHPVYSFHACAVNACIQNHMLDSHSAQLLECIPRWSRIDPPLHVAVTLRPGSHPRPPSPQPPVFSHSTLAFYPSAAEAPSVSRPAQDPSVTFESTEKDPECQGETLRPVVPDAPVPPPAESPAVLAQMKEMAKQQEALQQQSQQVQNIIQQIREEQSELKQCLEERWKQQQASAQAKADAPPAPVAAGGTQRAEVMPQGVALPDLNEASRGVPHSTTAEYASIAQKDLQALKDLEVDGCHISDGVFRGTPAQLDSCSQQQGITRAEAALLHNAGMGSMLLPSTALPTKVSAELEQHDKKAINTVLVQFVSLQPCPELQSTHKLARCYMRFQFFDLKPSETPVYMLEQLTSSNELQGTGDTDLHAYLLHPTSSTQSTLKYVVDGLHDITFMQQLDGRDESTDASAALRARHIAFTQYLATRHLSVDLFDADTRLQIGTASVSLQGLLRQGREHAECILKVPVSNPLDPLVQPPSAQSRHSSNRQHEACSASRGVLQVRLINIGSMHEDLDSLVSLKAEQCHDVNESKVRSLALLEENTNFVSELIPSWRGPPQVPEGTIVRSTKLTDENNGNQTSNQVLTELRKALRDLGGKKMQQESQNRIGTLSNGGKEADARIQERVLADAQAVRERHKYARVTRCLRLNRVHQHKVMAEYGKAVVLNTIRFLNPSGEAHTFQLKIDAPDIIRPINSHMELQALQHALGQKPDADKGTCEHSILAGDLLHLRAQEVLALPFLLQVHKGAQEDAFSQLSSNGQKLASNASSPSSPDAVRTVKLSLVSCTTGMEVCTHQISIVLRRPVLDRTFRFYAPHTDVLRESIKLESLPGREHTFYAPGRSLQQLFAISSHAHVVLTTRNSSGAAGSRDCISLKTKSQARTAQSETFYVTLYADALRVNPLETWQVHVHWLNSHEVTGTIGQASAASIILRGLPSQGRDVVLYCSHAELQLQPSRLHLPAAAQVEVKLQFKPSSVGLRNVVMNVVDSMAGALVDVILIRTHARVPHVSRVFEVDLPIGTVVNKKVGYRNMYHQQRKFLLSTSNPALVKFSHPELVIPAQGQRNIGIQVNSTYEAAGMKDVLIFINDEEHRNEETYRLRCHVYEP